MQLISNSLGIFVLFISSFIDVSISEPRVVCYYTNWSVYRPGTAKFNPQNINPYLCTHLIYSFGGFTKDNQLKPFDKYQDIEQGGYAKFTGLKTYNKELKTMLAIGGWNEGSTRFSPLVASTDRRSQLVKNTIKFLRQNKFDGLDLDWEYPAFRDGGKAKDRENYAKLVQELREEFDREHQKTGRPRLLLTMAVPAGFEYIDKGYDVPKLNKYLDWFNLLSYDYHSAYEPSVNHHAPLYPIEEENEYSFDTDLNINATIHYYLKNGADRDKLVLGIPTYGRSYTLFNPESNEIGSPADGPGEQGDATREKGYLAYYEICQSINEEDSEWTVVQPNPDALGPYAYNENQWVGYDDEAIVRKKSEFVVELKLGGIMFWSIDNDDFRGLCNGKPYPLIEAAKEAYLDGLENGVHKKSQFDSSKRKQQTTTRKPDTKKNSFAKSTTPPPPTTPSSGSDFKCEDEGFYSHPSDCTKYFWCLEAPGLGIVAHHFSCPSGLVFNKGADSCDYARNVHCEKKTPKTTTTSSTTKPTTTSTTEKISYNRLSTVYKNPSRTTPRTTTTSEPRIEIESSDLEQEDPKVIKELIELIKKAGGIEELEKQINNQEETFNGKVDSKVTTPTSATTINKSLVDKIRNRASLFKPRPPLFNGASQPERPTEQKTSTEKTSKNDEKEQYTPKKYNAINRFSRPEPQSAEIEKNPESDAVLIEKPQYTSILRRKPAKPDVIVENDYNNDSDRTSEEVSKTVSNESEITKKYTSISRPRRPQEQFIEESDNDDEEDDDDEANVETTVRTTASTFRSTNKYVNLSRRRSTTPALEEKTDLSVETTTSTLGLRTSQPLRRRTTTVESKPTEKTVLKIDTNSEIQIPRNTLDITLFKNTATDIERDTLIANKHLHEDDDINHIALPTESITENISPPDSVTTTQLFNTFSPQFNANEDKVNDILNDVVVDGTTEISDLDFTTISNENIVDNNDNGLSEQNNDRFINRNDNTVPRPFTRSKLFQKTTPPPIFSRNSISRSNNNNLSDNINDEQTTKIVRRRPTVARTSTSTQANDEDVISKPRPTYSYRPGYRGTARFRVSTTRSGEYVQDALESKVQLVDDNRLRSLNIDRVNKRPPISPTTTTERIVDEERTTRRRPAVTRSRITSTTFAEENEETSTESRIVEAKNRFSLDSNDRPDRIRFELSAGGKINFPEIAHKKAQIIESNSKVKVITGPLNKSPIEFSGRDLKKGHVEEIPIQTSPETVTIQNFSDKLDLNEIPLNKSDIESFVSDSDLRTESSIVEETTFYKKRQRPIKIGVKKPTVGDSSTAKIIEETESTTRKPYFNGNRLSLKIRSRPTLSETSTEEIAESGFQRKSQYSVNLQRNRFLTRTTQRKEIDSSTARYLTKIKVSDLPLRNNLNIEDSENSETQDAPEESTLRSFIESQLEDTTIDLDVLDMMTEKSLKNEYENDISTLQNVDYDVTENSAPETTLRTVPVRKLTIRKRPAKKIDFLAHRQTITESAKDLRTTPEIENTSSLSITTENNKYETEIETLSERETTSEKESFETTSNKPTRRLLLTRKRINENRISTQETNEQEQQEQSKIFEKQSTTPKTTRKRILTIKTKTGVIQSPVDIGIFETTQPTTETLIEEKQKIDDVDVIHKRIKVYRSRTTTETVTKESSSPKPIVTRTRVFKRPVTKQTETPEIIIGVDDEISSVNKPRYSQGRKVIKVTRRPIKEGSTTEEEKEENQQEEKLIESSTIANQKALIRKVLRTKTPRVIVDKPIEDDQVVIKTDEEIQQIDQHEVKLEESIPIENQSVSPEEPSNPIIKYPTRPAGRVNVTIRKRPSFNQGSRTTTIHPASTRFTKDGEPNVSPTRSKIGGKKIYRPGSRISESVVEENDPEVKPSFGKGTKKFFTKSYRKTSTTTTISPNITPHNIDIETETNDYDGVNDTTDIPEINNNNDILQNGKPRFTLSRFTTSTTSKPTTLHHVFAIDIEEDDMTKLKNANLPENQADEVIKKLQKLIEINRIVEVYSKEEKLKLLKNKKLKSIKAGELTLERPPALDRFGEITRQVIIKLSVKPNNTASHNVTTENPNDNRSPKNIMFSETVFGRAETSTISLEGLFDREKKELELIKEEISTEPYKNLIDIAELEQAIRNELQQRINKSNEETTTESLETTTLVNDD
ncbi:unnamed protein product [Chironomus riparius]|uniref:chitinase n=1 Tax=Chironomus riparius TaxID=315576 RepID=A0A9N9RJJ7_9DIPT|nr:unnamed protein product [Chironomus riparius]